jgi:hypothetical protein
MARKWILVALLLSLVGLGSARVDDTAETGRAFLAECQSGIDKRQMVVHLHCLSYLRGVIDAYQLLRAYVEIQQDTLRMPICLPEDGSFNVGVMRDVTRGWLHRHPEHHNDPVVYAIFQAMTEAYPCKPSAKKKK